MLKRLIGGLLTVVILLVLFAGFGIAWYFTSQALYPGWQTKDLSVCPDHRIEGWGEACGNLRDQTRLKFEDVLLPTPRGYSVPAWYLSALENRGVLPASPGAGAYRCPSPGRCAAFFVHGGGADRREGYRFAPYFLGRGFDFYMPDLVCHGEAACMRRGLSFGVREHLDALSVYNVLKDGGRYDVIIPIGTSVGGISILMALPEMIGVSAVVVENPMYSVRRFVLETKRAPAFFPPWYREFLYILLSLRGGFDATDGAAAGLRRAGESGANVPVFLLHGTADDLIPLAHTREMYEEYKGPKELRIVEGAPHARLWNADPGEYERQLDLFFRKHL